MYKQQIFSSCVTLLSHELLSSGFSLNGARRCLDADQILITTNLLPLKKSCLSSASHLTTGDIIGALRMHTIALIRLHNEVTIKTEEPVLHTQLSIRDS